MHHFGFLLDKYWLYLLDNLNTASASQPSIPHELQPIQK
jgi:hypothetical protein